MKRETLDVLGRLNRLGISVEDAVDLRRIAVTLQHWAASECNGEIERDDETEEVYRVYFMPDGTTRRGRVPIADREKSALKRLAVLLKSYPDLAAYHQTDPRGASLYVYRKVALADGDNIRTCYAGIGIAVY